MDYQNGLTKHRTDARMNEMTYGSNAIGNIGSLDAPLVGGPMVSIEKLKKKKKSTKKDDHLIVPVSLLGVK